MPRASVVEKYDVRLYPRSVVLGPAVAAVSECLSNSSMQV